MKVFSKIPHHFIVFDKGEEIITQLNSFIQEYPEIKSAWIQGIGAASTTTFSFFDPESKQYLDTTLEEPLEILNLQGNLSWVNNEPRWHIHGVFSNKKYEVFGGHVQDISIGLTGEIFLTPFSQKLSRSLDKKTGVQTIQKSHYDGHALQ